MAWPPLAHSSWGLAASADVGWETDDGVVPYWRGTIAEIEYRTG
ncbi:hypothetical protein [Halorhabdus salina]|nr:hypothetical protein [Halorhabdus salina]